MDALTILSKYHKEWLNIVRLFGDNEFAEDIVQDVYLKVHQYNYQEKIIIDGEPNRALMWILLRNTTYRENKIAPNDLSIELVRDLSADELRVEKHESLDTIYDKVEQEISRWDWYDQKLWKIYKDEQKSMRQISDETGISLKSIFLTLKSCKERIRQSVGEDYTDFINQEFELI